MIHETFTQYSTVYTVMRMTKNLEQNTAVQILDEVIYYKSKEIQWRCELPR